MKTETKAHVLQVVISLGVTAVLISLLLSLINSWDVFYVAIPSTIVVLLSMYLRSKIICDIDLPEQIAQRDVLPQGSITAPEFEGLTLAQDTVGILRQAGTAFVLMWAICIFLLDYIVTIPTYHKVIAGLFVLIYIHEAIRGPHRKWWISHILGEWRWRAVTGETTAQTIYTIDRWKETRSNYRLRHFFGETSFKLFHRYWLEVKLEDSDLIGYVPVDKATFERYRLPEKMQTVTVSYRTSRLHPDRLQLTISR
jgi:hypothetical protein